MTCGRSFEARVNMLIVYIFLIHIFKHVLYINFSKDGKISSCVDLCLAAWKLLNKSLSDSLSGSFLHFASTRTIPKR